MPSIPLDPTRWVLVKPESSGTQVITSRGGACFFPATTVAQNAPPEETSENTFSPAVTEVAVNTTTTVTLPKYFKAKKQTSSEELKPVILELAQPVEKVEGGQLTAESVATAAIANSAVTEPKLGTAAVTVVKTKVKTDAVPTGTESLTAVAGTSGVGRTISFGYSAKKEANAKVKLIHNLGTTALTIDAFTTSSKIASEFIPFNTAVKGSIEKIKVESANEVLITLVATEPGSKEEFIYIVQG